MSHKQVWQRKRFSVAHLMGSLFALDQLQYINGCLPLVVYSSRVSNHSFFLKVLFTLFLQYLQSEYNKPHSQGVSSPLHNKLELFNTWQINENTFTKKVKNSTSLINKVFYIYSKVFASWLKFSDPPEGSDDGAGGAPVAVPPVLPRSQEVLSASVVGVLVEDPVAIHIITGVDVAVMETVRHTGTVIHELHHVTTEVGFLVDTQSVGASVLQEQSEKSIRCRLTNINPKVVTVRRTWTWTWIYHWNHPARADTATEAHPPLVVGVLAPPHEVLVAHKVGSLVDHEAAALHPDGVAPAEVRVKVCAVIAALIAPTLEVLVLVKDNLRKK